ncbi:hypothetical protein LINPERHAP2_LOCUS4682 [Linum perenne]
MICFDCGCYGHKDDVCKQEPEVVVMENQTTSFANPIFQGGSEPDVRPEVEEDFGPWMQIKKNRQKKRHGVMSEPNSSSAAAPAKNAEKANRFSAFENGESPKPLVQPESCQDPDPLKADSKEHSVEDVLHPNKETVDPSPTVPSSKVAKAVVLEKEVDLSFGLSSSVPSLGTTSAVGPIPAGSASSSPHVPSSKVSGKKSSVKSSLAKSGYSTHTGGDPFLAFSSSVHQKKGAAPPKASKPIKQKVKEGLQSHDSKTNETNSLSGQNNGVTDMVAVQGVCLSSFPLCYLTFSVGIVVALVTSLF